jgi:lipopolysaccharide/colanic/teichoic acid biosynthesis glycosyltransferase
MVVYRSIGIRTLSLLVRLAIVTCSFWGWLYIWESDYFSVGRLVQRYLLYNEFLLIGILFSSREKPNPEDPHHEFVRANRKTLRQAFLALFFVFLLNFILQDTGADALFAREMRTFFLSYVPWLYLTLLFSNYLLPRSLAKWAFSGDRQETVAVVGTLPQAIAFEPWLERKSLVGFRTVGLITPGAPPAERRAPTHFSRQPPAREISTPALETQPALAAGGREFAAEVQLFPPAWADDLPLDEINSPDQPVSPAGLTPPFPILGTTDELTSILRDHCINHIVLLDLSTGAQWVGDLTQHCENAGVRLLARYSLDGYFKHTTTTFEDDGVRFISLREEPLENPFNRFIKRLLDIAIALPVVTLILPPATLLVWVLQRFQSPGPVFFWQVRSGMLGRPFRMLKYRTMHLHNPSEERQASQRDPRVYPAGRWLRKLSLDELPQFLNVLYGNMSVVGPRPHLPKHDEAWARVMNSYLVRKLVRPGITGWAQIQGFRGEVLADQDINDRVQADIHYLEHWSFSLDCLIILKTVLQCLFPPRKAY